MQLDNITISHCRIKDEQSPNNNAQLNAELLLSGDEVCYIQPINNDGKIILECFGSNALYQSLVTLSRLKEPVILDAGSLQIPVLFDYRESPCIKWNDTRKFSNPPATFEDFFTINLKAI